MAHSLDWKRPTIPAWFVDFTAEQINGHYIVRPISQRAKDYLFSLNGISLKWVDNIDKFSEKLPFTSIFIYL